MKLAVLGYVIFLLIGLSFGEDDFVPDLRLSPRGYLIDSKVWTWWRGCSRQNFTNVRGTIAQFSPCINCTCKANGTFDCQEWYASNGNSSQIKVKSCSNCDPFQFSNSLICKCYDDYSKVYREPFEQWKPTKYLQCSCGSRGISCHGARTYPESLKSFFDSRSYWLPKPSTEFFLYPAPVSVSKVINKTKQNPKDCNFSGIELRDGTFQNVTLAGYPRCLKCACYNGNPYCYGKWKLLWSCCNSLAGCKELVNDALALCRHPDNIQCEKDTYSWSVNGCNYSCTEKNLHFKMIKRPWCQRLTNSKYCAACGNKTAFFEKYGSKLSLCTRIEDVIDKEKVCNGFADCKDGTDEENCAQIYCSATTSTVADRLISWPRTASNNSFLVNCAHIHHRWKGMFVKSCERKFGQRSTFLKGTYCNCRDSRVFRFNISSVGHLRSKLLAMAKKLKKNIIAAVRASQFFEGLKNFSTAAININYTNTEFWKNMDSILQHDAPCEEQEIAKQMEQLRRTLPGYDNSSIEETNFFRSFPQLGAQIASYQDVLISEKRVLEMLLKPEGIVIKPEKNDAAVERIPAEAENKVNDSLHSMEEQLTGKRFTNETRFVNGTSRERNMTENDGGGARQDISRQRLEEAKRKLERIRNILRDINIATITEAVIGSISIATCVICLILYRVLNIQETTKFYLHKNLFIAWILSYGLQIIGNSSSGTFEKHQDFCTAYLIINQYTLLSFYTWMSLEGFNLFMVLVFVFEARNRRHYLYSLVGWGLPLCIVAIEAGVFFETFRRNKSCVGLEKNDWLFKGPMGFLLSVNCIFFCAIIFMLLKSVSRSGKYTTKASKSRATGKAFLVLLPLLGVTFFLGYAVKNTVVMYIYVVVNSSMGLLLSIFHFFLDNMVQKAYQDYKRKKASKKNTTADINSTRLSRMPARTTSMTA